jgi:hypothetical protein
MSEGDGIIPLFEPPLLWMFNQEEITIDNETIGVGDRVWYIREEAGEANTTLPRDVLVVSILATNNRIRGFGLRATMENQNRTLKLPLFREMWKDDGKKQWLMCEAICYVKMIIDEEKKITHMETMFRDRSLMWYMMYKEIVLMGQTRYL